MEECYSDQRGNKRDDGELLTELDMAAAQQLMQLSDEENHSSIKENILDDDHDDDEDVDQRLIKIINDGVPNTISSRSRLRTALEKIEEIFGKEEEEEIICGRPLKKRKCRSLASIYRQTQPIDDDDDDDDDHKSLNHEKKMVKKSS